MRSRKENAAKPELHTEKGDAKDDILSWVEVLCSGNNSTTGKDSKSPSKSIARWVPIHPEQESFDKPEEVESILAWRKANGGNLHNQHDRDGRKRSGKFSSKLPRSMDARHANEHARKSPVSYVLAVEHLPRKGGSFTANQSGSKSQVGGMRVTDVTPRYANNWSRTLRLRGATGKEIKAGGGKCVDEWWETSLERMNEHCRPSKRARITSPSKSSVRSVTKKRTKAGREVEVLELDSSDDDDRKPASRPNDPDESDTDEHDSVEAKELSDGLAKEKIPTSKKAFKESPFYVIPSVLNSADVLHPDARKRIAGVFKGELGKTTFSYTVNKAARFYSL